MSKRPSIQQEYQRQLMLRWITTITQWLMSAGAILFVLGLVYLLYAVLFANLDSQSFTPQDQARIRDNLALAGNALLLGRALS
jgi:hypothetical protein